MNHTRFKFKTEFFQPLFCPADAEFELDNLLLFSYSRMSLETCGCFLFIIRLKDLHSICEKLPDHKSVSHPSEISRAASS
ncbi:hypothetical protein HMPREF0542_11289 [Ligilactobacillus ruminis ATCC 25644]|uniref:Uncharacterized protein n=1 Tax=Ligilactobacillus ruminis ATCC 25644 TaxID=525362 RepID=E7FQW2_9LACO|nr:hypothetical protein HMPREF0542_11289 [Ligilactobacillus ruminis ATCC 25644]EGX98657.1 hypothetical protein ANHS_785 [Ligilactobacillus ruminis ATCC 25644]